MRRNASDTTSEPDASNTTNERDASGSATEPDPNGGSCTRTPRDVREALATHTDDYEVRRERHAVPPHAVYEVLFEGRRAVCKLRRHPEGDPATEASVMEHVARKTSVPVPSVLAVGEDHFVAAWHDGAPTDPALSSERARTMGAGLATLHEQTAVDSTGTFDASADGLVLDARDSWAATLRTRLERCRAFLEPYGYADLAAAVIEFLREHPAAVDGRGDPVLVHGNYLLEHVGCEDGAVTCVLDFEHALAGAAAFDYWATAFPTFESPNGSGDESAREAFCRGYESVRSLPVDLNRRRPVYAAVLGITYLRSLYLQRRWESRADADRRARALASSVRDGLETVRGRLE